MNFPKTRICTERYWTIRCYIMREMVYMIHFCGEKKKYEHEFASILNGLDIQLSVIRIYLSICKKKTCFLDLSLRWNCETLVDPILVKKKYKELLILILQEIYENDFSDY